MKVLKTKLKSHSNLQWKELNAALNERDLGSNDFTFDPQIMEISNFELTCDDERYVTR